MKSQIMHFCEDFWGNFYKDKVTNLITVMIGQLSNKIKP